MTERIWDISPTLDERLPVWPGDTPFRAETTWEISQNCPVKVSKIILSTHTGAHCDAPSHYDKTGNSIDLVGLSTYIGPCRVIHLPNVKSIEPEHLVHHLHDAPARFLIRTYAEVPTTWDPDFAYISAAAIHLLAQCGVQLIGIDTPSLDPQNSKEMAAHHAVAKHRMAILEGVVLEEVMPGDYELIALPLKLAGLDASPVRAILRTLRQ